MESPKYNRTYHFPWSPGALNDDKIATSVEGLIGVPLIVTEKMDGSNTSLEREGCFARTHSGPPNHPSFDGLKALHGSLKWQLVDNVQYFGEWCFAKHSIEYSELPGYFLLFGIRVMNHLDLSEVDGKLQAETRPGWMNWDAVESIADHLGVPTVPVLHRGQVSSEKELKELTDSFMNQPSVCGGIREGVVVRIAKHFWDDEFSSSIMKCVRANHVQTSEHWKNQEIIRNKLRALDSP